MNWAIKTNWTSGHEGNVYFVAFICTCKLLNDLTLNRAKTENLKKTTTSSLCPVENVDTKLKGGGLF